MKKLPGVRNRISEERAFLDVCHRTARNRPIVEYILGTENFFDSAKRHTGPGQWKGFRDSIWTCKYGEITGASIMSALRDHLASIQGENCCYCGQPLLLGGNSRQLDHVLPSSVYDRFAFHFWNLAVACERCNRIKKNTAHELVSSKFKHYPEHNLFANQYHPRYHKYRLHVQFGITATTDYFYIVFVGKTNQGKRLVADVLQTVALEMNRESNDPVIKQCAAKIHAATKTQGPRAIAAMSRFQQAIREAVEAAAT